MSKRIIFPQQSGDRKKPRLDFSISDHNFPLSQNAGSNNVADHFDDIDDELLLQASQACEQACNASVLPTYSQFMPPVLASTQRQQEPSPSTSKGVFTFRKPTAGQTNIISKLKDKCDLISSPLCGTKVTETIDLTDNYFNDKVLDIEDTDYVYRQLLQLKEENAKLKSENGKLLEKCVTKEGEASILRTQLKTYQIAVDNARLEKIKTREQAQIQWSEKLNTVNKQLSDIRTQLDSKNLEIISMKEKCKMLESNKVKLTQITVAGNEMSRVNSSVIVPNNCAATLSKRAKTASTTVQTDNNPQFLKLSKHCRLDKTSLTQILPLILDSAADQQHSILDYNKKLKRPTEFSPNKSRILNSFYRPSSSTDYVSNKTKVKMNLSSIYEDLMCIAACNNDVEKIRENYIKIFDTTRAALEGVQHQLEMVSKRLTSAFQKEMDKLYLETTTTYLVVEDTDLIAGKPLFKEEQSILARRFTAVWCTVLADAKGVQLFDQPSETGRLQEFIDLLCRICSLLDNNCCGLFYSGLLMSIVMMMETLAVAESPWGSQPEHGKVLEVVRHVVACRGMLFVPRRLLRLLSALREVNVRQLCSGSGGNLKFDYDQGVLLFKKDSCLLLVFLRQVEAAVKCMEQQRLVQAMADTTRDLLQLYSNTRPNRSSEQDARCKCGNLLVQVVVHALKICSTMLEAVESAETDRSLTEQTQLLSVCRSGLQALYQCTLHDVEFMAQLGYNEGNLIHFCEQLHRYEHNEFYSTMLAEMISTFQAVAEDGATSSHRQVWLRSFDTFSLAD